MSELLPQRRQQSIDRLARLVEAARKLEPIVTGEPLCIYITGSYGRLEAVVHDDLELASDLDLFFLYGVDDPDATFPRTRWFRLAGQLIELAENLGFPPFSGDAEWLAVHNVSRMREQLGSPHDDSVNAFTARMLFLLESRPVLDAALYDRLIERVVGFYFEDYEDHDADFRPTFLLNDILRFWRTLTLNYEHRRQKRLSKPSEDDPRAKTAVENLKLGFSRLNTCFSMVVPLSSSEVPVSPDPVVELTRLSPTERWESIDHPLVSELLEVYEWFLARTEDKKAARESLRDPDASEEARRQDKRFGDLVFALLQATARPEILRYVVV